MADTINASAIQELIETVKQDFAQAGQLISRATSMETLFTLQNAESGRELAAAGMHPVSALGTILYTIASGFAPSKEGMIAQYRSNGMTDTKDAGKFLPLHRHSLENWDSVLAEAIEMIREDAARLQDSYVTLRARNPQRLDDGQNLADIASLQRQAEVIAYFNDEVLPAYEQARALLAPHAEQIKELLELTKGKGAAPQF